MTLTVPFASYTTGGGILTFALPMLLFIIIAGTLYAVFTTTRNVPGHHMSTLAATPGPAPVTAAVTDTATSPEGGGAAPSPGPAPVSVDDLGHSGAGATPVSGTGAAVSGTGTAVSGTGTAVSGTGTADSGTGTEA